MVRHNNMIPNAHFHKKWQKYVKTWFNQPMKKKRRAIKRKLKVKANLPRPSELLRPMVHCPTVRYNSKIRVGRGFSLQELKAAHLTKNYAQSIGIAVDVRKRNKSMESMMLNVQRLKEYCYKLIVFSHKKKQKVLEVPHIPLINGINKPFKAKAKIKAKVPSEEEKAFCANKYIRTARFESKYASARLRKKTKKHDGIDQTFKRVRQEQD